MQEELVSVRGMMMAAGLVLLGFCADSAQAAEDRNEQDSAAVMSVMQTVADTWNSGKGIARDCFESSLTIVDNTPPYLFEGPRAMEDWVEAYRNGQPKETKDAKTTLHFSPPQSFKIKDTRAYIAVPAEWSVEHDGHSNVAHGTVTASLTNRDQHWRITAWTWTPR
jgi:hypothetical protein